MICGDEPRLLLAFDMFRDIFAFEIDDILYLKIENSDDLGNCWGGLLILYASGLSKPPSSEFVSIFMCNARAELISGRRCTARQR